MHNTADLLLWLKNRLELKYKDSVCSQFLYKLSLYFSDTHLDEKILDTLCAKVYIGFDNPDKQDTEIFDVAYTKEEKKKIKQNVQQIIDTYHYILANQ